MRALRGLTATTSLPRVSGFTSTPLATFLLLKSKNSSVPEPDSSLTITPQLCPIDGASVASEKLAEFYICSECREYLTEHELVAPCEAQ
ncbi:MAG: hypothetical protein B5766_05400 [Candidatus Lumbricidophila eiseniae]|uniref:Uncharacterized protein n=1 Tax=Candidatus Lumbricidiphila eiseniae TaxID=1969409 RepID=A0A2A6FRK1_9MICO|nr:MAG: hypothetical protein B5766_05400 [Candidatus Lumbricidophila eiseniae]